MNTTRDKSVWEAVEQVAFGDFTLDVQRRRLLHDHKAVEIGCRALDVLAVLVGAGGEVVSKDTLLDRVWSDAVVEENNLQVQVSAIRRAFGAHRDFIATVPGRGYRFTGLVQPVPNAIKHISDISQAEPRDPGAPLSIMVVPFRNLNECSSLDYLVDGVTDSLITDLSRVLPGSFVVSRSTAFIFKQGAIDTRRIGRQVGVRYILAGSIMVAGDRARVNAQLIDAETETQLWAERFDKPCADVLTIQDEIVSRLARSIKVELIRNAADRHPAGQDFKATDLALKGRALLNERMDAETAARAGELFRQALALDPGHAGAQVGLALSLVYQLVNFYRGDRDEVLATSQTLVDQALTSDPNNVDALKVRAVILRAGGQFHEAILANKMVLARNPAEPTACREIGLSLLYLGEFTEAVDWLRGADRIMPIDPIRWTWLQGLGRALIALGHDDDAVAELRLAVESRPGVPEVYSLLAAAEALCGAMEKARQQMAEYLRRQPGMTLQTWMSRSHVPLDRVSAAYRVGHQRVIEGLRAAGLPDA